MTDNARKIVDFLKENHGMKITAQETAKELNVTINAVTGTMNGSIKKGLAFRDVETSTDSEGKPVETKYIGLTDEGMAFDYDAEPEKKSKKAKVEE